MLFSFWIALLLVPAVTEAQSGDVDADTEPRVICTSHISRKGGNSLTCNLGDGGNENEDDEDDEGDDVESMTVCFRNMIKNTTRCLERPGDTVASAELYPINAAFNLTVQLKRGGKIRRTLDLRKIVKPRSPQVWNATFDPRLNKAVIHIRSPYQEDYLKPNNQLFQLHIWSAGNKMIHNITSSESLTIEGEYLQKNTEYHVKVRAIPSRFFQGTWSEWSATLNFSTHTVQAEREESRVLLYNLTVTLVTLVLVTWSIYFLWKKKIHTYMWPSIPHPKHTLVQICKPIKGLPVSFNPEVFSDLNIYPVENIEEQHCGEAEPMAAAAAVIKVKDPCSTRAVSEETSDSSRSNTSVNTEESAASTLLSRSSSGGDDRPRSRSPSPVGVPQLGEGQDASQPEHNTGKNDPEIYGVTQQGKDEAYVTMSSFYQIK